MKKIDVIRISIRLLETNAPHAILALPAKKRELDRLLADKEYVPSSSCRRPERGTSHEADRQSDRGTEQEPREVGARD
ncbi:hypothetical protein [Exiguobacterium sp. N4-1P]|uniref:hypothetical protein n=1 Tax=Exiguobacterium sp. N4-1P TaxID=2051906 RepID=UPI0012FFB365|nr:hypothetical protein [Exiguobacterium sp. N4-1P]